MMRGFAKTLCGGIVTIAVGSQTVRVAAAEVYVNDSATRCLRQIRVEDCDDHVEQERGPFRRTFDLNMSAMTTPAPQESTWSNRMF
jgi:hypothetical protein